MIKDPSTLRELTLEEIEQVSGGKADFSGVTSRVDSTAEIVFEPLEQARRIMLMQLLR
ncbi:MAG TPA: hypothetical protein VM687_02635 [Stenotrophomonas sp.]|nr:hypothetical protein [Stenotrophomonas sp.]